jgi:hypothetical protein
MTNSAEEYLEKKVRGLIEPMVSSLLMDRPKEPVIINNIDNLYDRMASKLLRTQKPRT